VPVVPWVSHVRPERQWRELQRAAAQHGLAWADRLDREIPDIMDAYGAVGALDNAGEVVFSACHYAFATMGPDDLAVTTWEHAGATPVRWDFGTLLAGWSGGVDDAVNAPAASAFVAGYAETAGGLLHRLNPRHLRVGGVCEPQLAVHTSACRSARATPTGRRLRPKRYPGFSSACPRARSSTPCWTALLWGRGCSTRSVTVTTEACAQPLGNELITAATPVGVRMPGVDQLSHARRLLLDRFRWTSGHADFAAILRDPEVLATAGPALVHRFRHQRVDCIAAVEARGFVLGALAARELGVGLALIRKPGAVHPGADRERASSPDWRGRHLELELSRRAVRPDDRVLLVDDWIETGSQACTAVRLVERLGGLVVGVTVLVDDTSEEVRRELNVVGLVTSDELPQPASTGDH
jgi:adenine phosphoribosyltransferase